MDYDDISGLRLHQSDYPPRIGPNHSAQLQQMLSDRYITNSYKLYWFGAILDELNEPKPKLKISYRRLTFRMIAKAWYSVDNFRLSFGYKDQLAQTVKELADELSIDSTYQEDDIVKELEKLPANKTKGYVKEICRYVPSRLISVFYPSVVSSIKRDWRLDNALALVSCENEDAIYQNHRKQKRIVINQKWYEYLKENMAIIRGWLRYRVITYLQSRNPNVPAIPFKIEAPQKRKLMVAKKYWHTLYKAHLKIGEPLIDIYTQDQLPRDFSIDHFIPWSFVLHDQLWNLVPTYGATNSAKSNRLPILDEFLLPFCKQQYKAINAALNNKQIPRKTIEEYYSVFSPSELREMSFESFADKLSGTIEPLHKIAHNMGFQIWHESHSS